jgi:hypothetical protein
MKFFNFLFKLKTYKIYIFIIIIIIIINIKFRIKLFNYFNVLTHFPFVLFYLILFNFI